MCRKMTMPFDIFNCLLVGGDYSVWIMHTCMLEAKSICVGVIIIYSDREEASTLVSFHVIPITLFLNISSIVPWLSLGSVALGAVIL